MVLRQNATIFNEITASATELIGADKSQPDKAHSLILEVLGGASANFTLDIQGKVAVNGTFTNVDFVQIEQAGAAALSISQLTVNDQTVRFYLVPNLLSYMRLVATRTAGSLTVHYSYSSQTMDQWFPSNASGVTQIEGPDAHDAVSSNPGPVPIGGYAITGDPVVVANADAVRAWFNENGALATFLTDHSDGTLQQDWINPTADGKGASQLQGWAGSIVQFILGPDGAFGRVKGLGDAVGAGLGILGVGARTPGSSEVKTFTIAIGATSATRNTALTPTSGKKIRLLTIRPVSGLLSTNPGVTSVYFGTGAAYLTNPASAVGQYITGVRGSDHDD
ncbi:MAG: hypothetical protein V3S68_09560, partial [Dehalococcoidia bacterium]